jgi:hypothetical protein
LLPLDQRLSLAHPPEKACLSKAGWMPVFHAPMQKEAEHIPIRFDRNIVKSGMTYLPAVIPLYIVGGA